jgi:hypothetical protein
MQTPTTTASGLRPQPTPPDAAPLVAVEALLLQPRDRGGPVATMVDRGPWPILVIVLDDHAALHPGAKPLLDLLNRPRATRIAIAHSHYRWSVDPAGVVLKLALHTHEPTTSDLDVVMPARPLLGILSQLPPGVTFAMTTRQRADRLTKRVCIRDALHEMVLLVSPAQSGNPDDGLAALRRNGHASTGASSRHPIYGRFSETRP